MNNSSTLMQAGPFWPLVVLEEEFDQFTSEMLSTTVAPGNPVEVFVHWVGILAGKWKPVWPEKRDEETCCVGEITRLTISGDGDICFYIKPSAECLEANPGLLAASNKGELVCELPWARRDGFKLVLPRLKKGNTIGVCGYAVIDGGHGGQHELHSVTSIDLHP